MSSTTDHEGHSRFVDEYGGVYEEWRSDLPGVAHFWHMRAAHDDVFYAPATPVWGLRFNLTRHRAELIGPQTIPVAMPYQVGETFLGLAMRPEYGLEGPRKSDFMNRQSELEVDGRVFTLSGKLLQYPQDHDGLSRLAIAMTEGSIIIRQAHLFPKAASTRSRQRYARQAVGMSERQQQMIARVTEAVQLIENGLPASQAAEQTGFADQAHLQRAIKAQTGLTPGALRRIYRS